MGLTLLHAAEKLHVDPKVLEALESENFDALGAAVFVRGHIRRYAEFVGENIAELQSLYTASTQLEQPDLTNIPKADRRGDPGRLVFPALVVMIGFALAGVIWWVLSSAPSTPLSADAGRTQQVASESPEASRSQAQQASPASQAAPEVAAAVSGGGARAGSAQAAPSAQAAGVASVEAQSAGNGLIQPASLSNADMSAAADVPTAARGEAASGPVRVRMSFSADCWVEVYDASGARLFFNIATAGTARTLTGTPPLRVVLGNAPGVALEMDGRPVPIAEVTRRNGTAEFIVDRSGRPVRASSR